ncbi:2-hydroxychromene-2-carboxylate isomerase/DsbA-like thioredoxin domain [Halalkalibacter wakoensis JCM 9140]|uniref:2-hydroxychromene-2-carboxylate isomerase/DsbA-like thioredoxin domain n=2 Tax=Halalkalibacter wakoensis TaxID=127891 RepID=W4Q1Q7_9BACI|nr:2-hydroxychromene-2-carboxylate isomerase/DsbA-like thioredoxin domain [Halalkalibacter wakoensis JCM 9140]
MERDVSYSIYEKLASKYGMSIEQAKANCDNMEKMAQEVGLDFRFDLQKLTNTFDAHRLVMYAKTQGLMHEMTERILRAYYTEGKHIGDHATLITLADDVGLDSNATEAMLASTDFSDTVRQDEKQADQYNIRSIPFFLVNKKYGISGAQPTEAFVQSLEQIIEQDGLRVTQPGISCDEDGCDIPEK